MTLQGCHSASQGDGRVWYLVPDYAPPSWGNGTLYTHVRLLREQGVDASVLHHHWPFRLPWLEMEVPIAYLDRDFHPRSQDVVVVPEVLATHTEVTALPMRRVVFVQGSFLMLRDSHEALDYSMLGFERAMALMPHVHRIVERHFGIAAGLVPPVIAPYFFEALAPALTPRPRRVLLAYKSGYAELGHPDHDIARKLLRRRLARAPATAAGGAYVDQEWSLVELRDKSHRQVAELMRESAFLVCLNGMEAFNTVVPEAMAAGCIPLCYEAFGGQDYLRNEENALVFPNHYVYPLLERLFDLMDRYDLVQPQLECWRRAGAATAAEYSEAACARALQRFFAQLGGVLTSPAAVAGAA